MSTNHRISDAASVLGLSNQATRDLIAAGELLAVRLGRSAGYRIADSDLQAFIARRRAEAVARSTRIPEHRVKVNRVAIPKRLEW
jgi:excisionase family DNA binding protein